MVVVFVVVPVISLVVLVPARNVCHSFACNVPIIHQFSIEPLCETHSETPTHITRCMGS